MENRRNYYRVLQVQPGAPAEIIRASYRTLMQRLRAHPDLGGDHWNATIINEAYAVLSDPLKRARYDREVHAMLEHGRTALRPSPRRESPARDRQRCLFCAAPHAVAASGPADDHCACCGSPLRAATLHRLTRSGRRAIERLEHRGVLRLYTRWPQRRGIPAECRDLSLNGICFITGASLLPRSVVKLDGPLCDAVIEVVHVRHAPAGETAPWLVGARFLSVAFRRNRGAFVSVSV
jgi:hypothetical protein